MKTILGVLVVLCVAGLAACGDKASGAVGTWVLDSAATFEASRGGLLGPAQLPPDAAKAMEAQMKAGFEKMTVTITIKSDDTFTGKFALGDQEKEDNAGTWSAAGDKVTLQPKTKNGQPATGNAAKAMTLTLKGDTLSGKPDANAPVTIVLKRS
jgi:hypothetical protein